MKKKVVSVQEEITMKNEHISYKLADTTMQGEFFYQEDKKEKRPCILVAHAWMGQDDFARNKAKSLVEQGYIGFAIDIYGNKTHVDTPEEAQKLMLPLFYDRALLQERLQAAYNAAKRHPLVDSAKIGGIGFCFGGLSIIELFRSGVPLQGAVSFHAILGDEMAGKKAKTVPIHPGIKGSLMMLHGYDDPLVTSHDIDRMQKELTKANVDWQMHIYGHTSHAFTVPQANNKAMGLIYNQLSEKRSWISMMNFFEEVFSR